MSTSRKSIPNKVFADMLLTKRPDLSPKTLYGYADNLKLLYFKVFPNDTDIDVSKFLEKDIEFYTNFITNENKSNSYVRNMLSALKSFTNDGSLTPYITRASDADKLNAENPIASEYVNEHHLTPEMLEQKFNELSTEVEPLWNATDLTMTDFQRVQSFVMYSLVCGKFICPRRSGDWTKFKIRNMDTENDNYLDGSTFVFNSFKTSKHTGQQRIECPKDLYRILRKWIRYNPNEYLFVNSNFLPLTSVSYGQKLCTLFGSKPGTTNGMGTNTFRHIYLTNKHAGSLDLEQDLINMGSSIANAKYYIKKIATK